ncbi:MAG: patatin-like phospholipase family protein [Betaproteobacteria bacterium]|nr:patatin-like phospholipase family protein [Betaproteobacteria bacterium]
MFFLKNHETVASGGKISTISRKPKIGLVLGGGAARGWAHVGVIKALEAAGIRPDLVCGTSVGALVGVVYAAGELDKFEQWLMDMNMRNIFSLLDLRLKGGMLKGEKLIEFFRQHFVDRSVEELGMPYGAVATCLHTGMEVWLRSGSAIHAMRASIAFPGLFTPVRHEQRFLVDGGLVNPVPVSLARAMGAEFVIAVDLNTDLLEPWAYADKETLSVREVLSNSINIMQLRIARARLAGDPADVMITPKVGHVGFFDFHRGVEAIAVGEKSVSSVLPSLQSLL